MTDAEWRESYAGTHAHDEVAFQEEAAPAQPDATSEATSTERTPLWVGLLRLGLAAAAVATGSAWALPIVLWILLAHILLED